MSAFFRYADPPLVAKEWGIAVARIVVGITFLMHGYQKLFVQGIPAVAGFFTQIGVPVPGITAPLVSVLEFAGGAALVLGLATRWVAALLALDMLSATLTYHLPKGFFVSGGGYELVLLLLAGAVGIFLAGPGALAVDRLIAGRPVGGSARERPPEPA